MSEMREKIREARARTVEMLGNERHSHYFHEVAEELLKLFEEDVLATLSQLSGEDMCPPLRSGKQGSASDQAAMWRHRNGGLYTVVGQAMAQTTQGICDYDAIVVYRSEEDGQLWVRTAEEFHDGRFERVSDRASEQTPLSQGEATASTEGTPEGFVLVPKEPTEEMLKAALIDGYDDPQHEASSIGHRWVREAVWEAMIAAAPQDQGGTE